MSTARSNPLATLCTALLLFLSAAPVLALPSDREQPIEVESDSASRDDSAGTLTYLGTVVIDQGSLHIGFSVRSCPGARFPAFCGADQHH